jgi:Ca2+-transporting ATPase
MDRVPARGLDEDEARRRLAAEGPNSLPSAERHGIFALVLHVASEPMFLLLIAAASVYLVLGDLEEALVLAASIVVVLAITVVQERRTERALEALRDLSSPRALVLRGGREMRIAGTEVVRGDLLLLREGDRVPADARLDDAHDLAADESLLTGESVPVDKRAGTMVFSGTLVVRGLGRAEVTATGARSELGRIGTSLAAVDSGKTSLEQETARIVRAIAIFALGLCVVVALLYYATRGDPLGGVLAGLTLAMALLPEEFPVVLTVFLALGAWRISKHGVLTRRMPAIEMLGAATVLCCDKTGTLTENRMAVVEAWTQGAWRASREWDAREAPLLETAALACEQDAFDPMERAILVAAKTGDGPLFPGGESASASSANRGPSPKRYPLSEGFLAVCYGWRTGVRDALLAMKGAPETVLPLCAMADEARDGARAAAEVAARRGLRLLAVARASWEREEWPGSVAEARFEFLGFVALADPVRPTVPGAVALARRAGIRVVMITGDNGLTAQAVARQLGIGDCVVEARQLEGLPRQALFERMKGIDIVARATPQIKQQVLQALQDVGHFVAMTGDGVNDATALKQSDVGVAMGLRGTDIAKESAAMVLLDDNFSTIVAAVEEGRRIFDNIRKFTNYLLSTSLGEVFVVLALSMAGYFPLSAKMLLWVNVVTDLIPASALAADPVVPHVMKRRPRRHDEPILNKAIYATIAGSIFRTLIAYGLIFWVGLRFGGVTYARTMLFTSIVLHAFTRVMVVRQLDNLSLWSNKALLWSYAAAVGLQLLALYTPLRNLFGIVPLDWRAWAVMIPVVAGSSLAGVYMTRWILKLVPLWEA